MKPAQRPSFAQRQQSNSMSLLLTARMARAAALLLLVGLLLGSSYFASSASFSNKVSKGPDPALAAAKAPARQQARVGEFGSITALNARLGAPNSFALPLPVPQSSPITVATYASDCVTPKTVFNLQDPDPGKTVCAKVTGADPSWVIIWSNANGVAVQNVPVGSGTSTFTLTAASSLGDWRVILFEPFGGSVYAVTSFTVIDAANPSADLSISKAAASSDVSAGSQAVFTVLIRNSGPSDAVTVQVSDSVPANTTFASFAPVSGPEDINCVIPTVGSGPESSTICTIPNLARGETATFLAAYDVNAGVPSGTVIFNTASVSSSITDPNLDNNSSTADLRVSGVATETCTLDCPANVVVTANTTSGGEPGAFVSFGAASVSGNCGAVTNSPQSGSFFTVGTHSIVSTSEIGAASCTFTVTVLDTTPPTISCPPSITVTAPEGFTVATLDPGPGTAPATSPITTFSGSATVTGVRSDNIPATYDENGEVLTAAVVHLLTEPYPVGSTGILWTVTDAGGRKASCTQTITVHVVERDVLTITCPGNINVTAPSGSCENATVTLGTPATNPSDSHVTVHGVRSDGEPMYDCDQNGANCTRKTPDLPFPAGDTVITWTATDDVNDSVASCTQIVHVTGTDNQDPTLHIPANISVTTSSCSATLDDELGVATAEDNCTPSVNVVRTGVPANFVFPTGTTVITYTATDASGNTATGTQLVTVHELTPPTITAPANAAYQCASQVPAANPSQATASDDCGAPTVTVAEVSSGAGSTASPLVITRTFTAKDASNNMTSAVQTITVIDNTPPTITAPANAGYQCPSQVPAANASQATASDNCVAPTVTVSQTSNNGIGSTASPLVITRTFTATDAANNSASAVQTITVIDNTPPVITCVGNIIADFNPAVNGAVVTYTPPVGTDNCGATTIQTAGLLSGATFPLGTTTNTFTATDAAGNTASCSFKVTVALTSIIGLDSVTITGSAYADSYSSIGGYPATKTSLANVLSNGTITMGNSAKVWGNVRSTRAGVAMSGASQVTGNATAGTTVTTSNSATVGGTRTNNALAPVMTLPSVPACGPPYSPNTGISGTYSYNASTGDLTLSGVNIATLANGNYCFHNVTLGNSSQLKVNGPVVIKLTGTLNTSGATSLNNTTQIPNNLRILSSYSGSNGVVLGNSANIYSVIYAPNTALNISGAAPLFGTAAAKSITLGGSGAIHYDTALISIWPDLWTLIVGL